MTYSSHPTSLRYGKTDINLSFIKDKPPLPKASDFVKTPADMPAGTVGFSNFQNYAKLKLSFIKDKYLFFALLVSKFCITSLKVVLYKGQVSFFALLVSKFCITSL